MLAMVGAERSTTSALKLVTPTDYSERVRGILDFISRRKDAADAERRIPQETFDDLTAAGIFKVFQPKRWGGYELPPMSFFDAVYEISEVCPSTGWVYGVIGPHTWEVAAMSNQAQIDVWGENPDALVSSSFAPMGRVERVQGGYKLDGLWKYSSGADGCQWVLVGGVTPGEGGKPDVRNFLLPRSDYKVIDTWRTMGLKGTGSNDVLIENVFVPEHRSNSLEDAYYCRNPGQLENDGALYRLPFMALFAPLLSFAALGAAKGAHTWFVKSISAAAGKLNKGYDLAEETGTHLRMAKAISDIEASRALLTALINEMYQHALHEETIPLLLRKRIRFEAANAVDRAADAVMTIFKASGTSVVNEGHALQRYVMDVLTARTHVANIVERGATLYAREAFGVAGEPRGPGDFNT